MLELHNGSGVVICPEMDRCVWCVFLKLLGPSPGPTALAARIAPQWLFTLQHPPRKAVRVD